MQLLAECVKSEARAMKCERARGCCLASGVLPRSSFGGLAENTVGGATMCGGIRKHWYAALLCSRRRPLLTEICVSRVLREQLVYLTIEREACVNRDAPLAGRRLIRRRFIFGLPARHHWRALPVRCARDGRITAQLNCTARNS
jgi:hypothetical protein